MFFSSSELWNDEEIEDPRTIDVVGKTEFDEARPSIKEDDAPLPLYPEVLDHSLLLLVNGISLKKNPCDGSSNFMSKAVALPEIRRQVWH